jgi:reactive intermediate/imine deaminase|tara:strand:- start:8509 stop:8976 length:468 start_codon:yes stop_codon:yes gene_type:complete
MPASLRHFAASLLLAATLPTAHAADVEHLNGSGALPPNLPFSEAVKVGNLYFLSGQLGVKPGTMALVEGGIEAEARQTMENIATVLKANGLSMSDVVKCTVMLADMSEWGTFNEVYRSFFTPPYPARSAFGANGLGLGARAEVECIAADSGAATP